ncbi:MAG: DUF2336 domain-containing protein [Sphingomonas sp.]|nr:DUF2336 domain-containing protein [Sphingomonas sp.]
MMPVEWPLAATAADRPVDPVRLRPGPERLPVAKADFFLDERLRLTDEERSLMAAMLRELVDDIADELIAAFPPILAARAELLRDGLCGKLRAAGLLARDELVALLLRRAGEQRLSAHAGAKGDELVSALVGDADPAVAEAAMALALARGRRKDRFARLKSEFDDLPAEEAVALVSAVAAALGLGLNEGDQQVAAASRQLLAAHDEGRRLEARVEMLARALEAAGRADDEMIEGCARHGDCALMVSLLARRAGISHGEAWTLFSSGEPMVLARLAGCDRATAAQIVAAFEPMAGGDRAESFIERFDALSDDEVEQRRRWLRLDGQYRAAREALDRSNG